MKKSLLSVIVILVLFFSVGLSLHHHDDGLQHNDCPTCITASHYHPFASDGSLKVKNHDNLIEAFHLPDIFVVLSPFTFDLKSRSPPLSL